MFAAASLLAPLLEALDAKVQAADDAIEVGIQADPALRRRREIIRSVPGCGPLTAASLCAELPELGSATPAEAASTAAAASAVAASIRASCSTWPPPPRSVGTRPCAPSTRV